MTPSTIFCVLAAVLPVAVVAVPVGVCSGGVQKNVRDSSNCRLYYFCNGAQFVPVFCPAGYFFVTSIRNPRCIASTGYYCETGVPRQRCSIAGSIGPCVNGGRCVKNTISSVLSCQCDNGYSGNNCQTQQCTPPCEHGTCVMIGSVHQCRCDTGYKGNICREVSSCSLTCMNGGHCQIDSASNTHSCACPTRYTGNTCNTEIDTTCNPACQNNGTCIGGQCYCKNSYVGNTCQNKSVPRVCVEARLFCLNDGECVDNDGDAICNCTADFQGNTCERPADGTCKPECRNGGKCQRVKGANTCLCTPGWTGVICESASPCRVQNVNCNGNGICIDATGVPFCACNVGYTGNRCQTQTPCKDFVCKNNGVCQSKPGGLLSCDCKPGFYGSQCQLKVSCDGVVCLNDGTCSIDNGRPKCNCPTGLKGERCETKQNCAIGNVPCTNGGRCIDGDEGFICICPSPSYGVVCEKKKKCEDVTCLNAGTCKDNPDAVCTCTARFQGSRCQFKNDACGGCRNGGSCEPVPLPKSTAQACACPPSFTGSICETPVPAADQYDCPTWLIANPLIFDDPSNPSKANICKGGKIQNYEVCPGSKFIQAIGSCLPGGPVGDAFRAALATAYALLR